MGNTFDEQASTWDEKPDRKERAQSAWELLRSQIVFKNINSVLDYGCGTGLLGYHMVDLVEQITFCDTSKPMLEQVEIKRATNAYKNVKTLCADFTVDELPAEKYDLIVSMLVLHHVVAIDALLAAFNKVLNKDGKLVWIDLDEEDGSFHHHDDTIPHLGFSRSSLEALMQTHGFTIKYYSTELNIKKEVDEVFKEFPLFVLVAEK